jgi:hypothetical protein
MKKSLYGIFLYAYICEQIYGCTCTRYYLSKQSGRESCQSDRHFGLNGQWGSKDWVGPGSTCSNVADQYKNCPDLQIDS